MKNRSKKIGGFTFVEMLIVSSLVVVVALAIYNVLSNGVRIWERANETVAEEDICIFFDKFSTDLRNSFYHREISFLGKDDELEFATLVNSDRLEKRTVGSIRYIYNKDRKVLDREERDYSHIYREEAGLIKMALKGVEYLRFSYYFYDPATKKYYWVEEWEGPMGGNLIPTAVRMAIEVSDGKKKASFTRSVDIPAAG